jgi:hypothetical protein
MLKHNLRGYGAGFSRSARKRLRIASSRTANSRSNPRSVGR